MFQDDRMIPVLSAMVLMVVVGTVLQRADGVGLLFGADPAPGPVLRDDVAEAPGGALLRLDVLANDEGVTPEMRAGLRVVTAPACGRLFVRDGILEYIADEGCEGRQTIRYSVPGAGEGQAATVTARIRDGLDAVARRQSPGAIRTAAGADAGSADSMERAAMAAAGSSEPGRPSVRLAALLPPNPDGPAVASASPGAGPALAAPAGRPAVAASPSGRPIDLAAPAPPVAGVPGGLDDRPAPAPDGAVPHADPATAGQPAFLLAVVGQGGEQGGPAAARSSVTADTRAAAGAVPAGRSLATMGATPRPHPAPAVAALAAPAPAAAPPTSPGQPATPVGMMLAPATAAPAHALRPLADAIIASAPPDAAPERSGRLPRTLPATPPPAPGTPIDPGAYAPEPAAPEPAVPTVPAVTDHGMRPPVVASVAPAAATRALASPADNRAGAAAPAAEARAPCVAPPEKTLTVHPAAETRIVVSSPCHAGTVAELVYSGLRLAVPLDAAGEGAITALGFAPASTARLAFADRQTLAFDIPFRGVDRVSRVALAWDAPVLLALNALEHGADPGTPGHVGPERPRSFDEVRRAGGGWLTSWAPVGGTGQSVQVYSWYHRSGETPGIVRMLVDFVSRDRDRLPSACGEGADAAPRFTVLRAVAGRPDRPVLRRLAPVACERVAADEDNRLISGAVDDLVITSR